jgi:hypothetical protein
LTSGSPFAEELDDEAVDDGPVEADEVDFELLLQAAATTMAMAHAAKLCPRCLNIIVSPPHPLSWAR